MALTLFITSSSKSRNSASGQLQTARSRLDQNKVEYPNADFEEYKLSASNFKFDKIKNIFFASDNIEFIDTENNITIYSDTATYQKKNEIIFTKGSSKAINKKNTITATNFKFDRK